MDRYTGRPLSGESHLAQSIVDILGTPIGTRVMRRDYGSEVPALIDAPISEQTLLEFYRAVAEALTRWEPRVVLEQVRVVDVTDDAVDIELSGVWVDRAADAGAAIEGGLAQAGPAEVSL
ncbi:MAG: GPW/gp25 family protein [Pseudomonadota bacterium]